MIYRYSHHNFCFVMVPARASSSSFLPILWRPVVAGEEAWCDSRKRKRASVVSRAWSSRVTVHKTKQLGEVSIKESIKIILPLFALSSIIPTVLEACKSIYGTTYYSPAGISRSQTADQVMLKYDTWYIQITWPLILQTSGWFLYFGVFRSCNYYKSNRCRVLFILPSSSWYTSIYWLLLATTTWCPI